MQRTAGSACVTILVVEAADEPEASGRRVAAVAVGKHSAFAVVQVHHSLVEVGLNDAALLLNTQMGSNHLPDLESELAECQGLG